MFTVQMVSLRGDDRLDESGPALGNSGSTTFVYGTCYGEGRYELNTGTYRLRPASKTLSANARTKVTLKLSSESLRALRAAFAHRQRVKATLVVRIKNSAGNVTNKQLRMRLIK